MSRKVIKINFFNRLSEKPENFRTVCARALRKGSRRALYWLGAQMFESQRKEERVDWVERLNDRHIDIYRAFVALEDAVVWGAASQILLAAEDLAEIMLRHFMQEAQILENLPAGELKRYRRTRVAVMVVVGEVDEGLRRHELSAALHLHSLAKQWIREHMLVEREGPGVVNMVEEDSFGSGWLQA